MKRGELGILALLAFGAWALSRSSSSSAQHMTPANTNVEASAGQPAPPAGYFWAWGAGGQRVLLPIEVTY